MQCVIVVFPDHTHLLFKLTLHLTINSVYLIDIIESKYND